MPQSGPPRARKFMIEADPAAVCALITKLDVMTELAAETTSMSWRKGTVASPGAVFSGKNRHGNRTWTTTCIVTEAIAWQRFAFDMRSSVIPVAHRRYDIVLAAGSQRAPGITVRGITGFTTGVPDRTEANAQHIEISLQRLKERRALRPALI